MLLKNKKILTLKKNKNIVKFTNPNDKLTDLILCEPWREPTDFDTFESDAGMIKNATMRKIKMLPFVEEYPEDVAENFQ